MNRFRLSHIEWNASQEKESKWSIAMYYLFVSFITNVHGDRCCGMFRFLVSNDSLSQPSTDYNDQPCTHRYHFHIALWCVGADEFLLVRTKPPQRSRRVVVVGQLPFLANSRWVCMQWYPDKLIIPVFRRNFEVSVIACSLADNKITWNCGM